MTGSYKTEWNVVNDGNVGVNVLCAFQGKLREVREGALAAFADLLPFGGTGRAEFRECDGWVVCRLTELGPSTVMTTGGLEDEELVEAAMRLAATTRTPSFDELARALPDGAIGERRFVYVGPFENGCLSWPHLQEVQLDWLGAVVIPRIEELNRQRVLAALPPAPAYDPAAILPHVYVIENQAEAKQGTCFHLAGVGLITCAHVLGDQNVLLSSVDGGADREHRLEVLHKDERLDLALLRAPSLVLGSGLARGRSDHAYPVDDGDPNG